MNSTSHAMPTTQERLEAARAALHAPFRYELQRHEYDRYLRTFLIGLLGDVKQDVLEPSKCFMDPNQLYAICCASVDLKCRCDVPLFRDFCA